MTWSDPDIQTAALAYLGLFAAWMLALAAGGWLVERIRRRRAKERRP